MTTKVEVMPGGAYTQAINDKEIKFLRMFLLSDLISSRDAEEIASYRNNFDAEKFLLEIYETKFDGSEYTAAEVNEAFHFVCRCFDYRRYKAKDFFCLDPDSEDNNGDEYPGYDFHEFAGDAEEIFAAIYQMENVAFQESLCDVFCLLASENSRSTDSEPVVYTDFFSRCKYLCKVTMDFGKEDRYILYFCRESDMARMQVELEAFAVKWRANAKAQAQTKHLVMPVSDDKIGAWH